MASIAKTLEKQRVAQIGPMDQDIIGLARMGRAVDLQLLFVRGGLLIGRKDFFWADTKEAADEELIRSAIEQFYNKETLPPRNCWCPKRCPTGNCFNAGSVTRKAGGCGS